MPRSYWDYDSVNIQWGVLENYEVVRKIGSSSKKINKSHFTIALLVAPGLVMFGGFILI